jgi:hypothetical protein
VKSVATRNFWKLYLELPQSVRREAQEAFRVFCDNPAHPGLSLERLRCDPESWSVRITRDYRAVGTKEGDVMNWYWIGSHSQFDKKFPV